MEFINMKAADRQAAKKSAAKALRRSGSVPAIIYGKEKTPRAISIDAKSFGMVLAAGSRLFKFDVGSEVEQALLVDVQWDTFGVDILHADFSRVSDADRINVTVPIRLLHASQVDVGTGMLVTVMHSVSVEASVTAVPSEIELDIADLTLEVPKLASDLPLPGGVTLACNLNDMVVHIVERRGEVETAEGEEEGEEGAATPEGEGEGEGDSKKKED